MIMIQIGKKDKKSTVIKAGIAGAVIGAAGTAIGIAMSDKKNRDKVKESLNDAKKWTNQKMDSLQSSSQDVTEKAKNDVKKARRKIEPSEETK